MCSSGDSTLKETEKANAALTKELGADYAITFAENQAIQKQLTGVLNDQLIHPQGLPGSEIAAARTNAIDTTAVQFQNAQRGANAVAAAHGGDALPSGVNAQVAGGIAANAAAMTSKELNDINVADAQAKQASYWNAISGLNAVGKNYDPTGYSNSAAGTGNSTANLGQAFLATQQAGWSNAMGIVGAVGGLASGAGAIGTGFGLGNH